MRLSRVCQPWRSAGGNQQVTCRTDPNSLQARRQPGLRAERSITPAAAARMLTRFPYSRRALHWAGSRGAMAAVEWSATVEELAMHGGDAQGAAWPYRTVTPGRAWSARRRPGQRRRGRGIVPLPAAVALPDRPAVGVYSQYT